MAVQAQAQASEVPRKVHATWLWNPWMFINDEASTFAFLENKQVNKVYVQIDQDISKAAYSNFIGKAKAKAKGIDVTNEGSSITFAGKGEAFMNQELAKVAVHYAANPAYKGNAVHHVGSWLTLRS